MPRQVAWFYSRLKHVLEIWHASETDGWEPFENRTRWSVSWHACRLTRRSRQGVRQRGLRRRGSRWRGLDVRVRRRELRRIGCMWGWGHSDNHFVTERLEFTNWSFCQILWCLIVLRFCSKWSHPLSNLCNVHLIRCRWIGLTKLPARCKC